MAISEVQSPGEGAKTTLTEHPLMLSVNGEQLHAQVMADTPLLLVLRNDLALNGPKYGCGTGECGACTVLIDGVAARSCVIPALGVSGRAIVTRRPWRSPAPAPGAACLYRRAGGAMRLLPQRHDHDHQSPVDRNPAPSEAEIRQALSGNLCRCGTHLEILRAVQRAIILCRDEDAHAHD